MKRFYVLIDSLNGTHYGFTFDEIKAREKAFEIEEKIVGSHIEIYVFSNYHEF